ncbi:MAG: hypothetical protein JWR21_4371 [Herminiimonas sp.]|nr:hypothetical protein [Herminiimonas sp.]
MQYGLVRLDNDHVVFELTQKGLYSPEPPVVLIEDLPEALDYVDLHGAVDVGTDVPGLFNRISEDEFVSTDGLLSSVASTCTDDGKVSESEYLFKVPPTAVRQSMRVKR